jgi:hypothetical protein
MEEVVVVVLHSNVKDEEVFVCKRKLEYTKAQIQTMKNIFMQSFHSHELASFLPHSLSHYFSNV